MKIEKLFLGHGSRIRIVYFQYYILMIITALILVSCSVGVRPKLPLRNLRPDEMANLEATKLTLSPAYPTPEEQVEVRLEVRNRASIATRNVEVQIFSGKQQIASRIIDIQANSLKTILLPWRVPAHGIHTITAIIDPNEELIEIDRLDNMISIDVVVAAPIPPEADFEISSLDILSPPDRPQMLRVIARNNGQVTAEAPLNVLVEGRVITSRLIGPIRPGASVTVEEPWSAEILVPQLSAEINPRYRTLEENPENNFVSVDPRPSVDLNVKGVSVYAQQFERGSKRQVTISFKVLNEGKTAIDKSFRIRTFSEFVGSDSIQPFYVTTSGLGSKETVYLSHTFIDVPEKFNIRIEADSDHIIEEDNEENNIATSHFQNPTPDVGRWVSIGPRRIITGLGAVGRLHEIAIDPTDPMTIYVGSPHASNSAVIGGGSGVWKTTNGGLSWQPVADALPSLTISALSLDPSVPSRVYIVTPRGIFRSEDAGTSWIKISEVDDLNIKNANEVMIIHPTNSDILYLTSNNGLHRSSDRGVTWELLDIPGGVRRANALVMDQSNPTTLYAGMQHNTNFTITGVYKSLDGGDTWTKLTGCPGAKLPPITAKTSIRLALSGSTLYASFKTSAPNTWTLYRTTEMTCSIDDRVEKQWQAGWSPTGTDAVTDPKPSDLWSDIYVDPADPKYVYATGTQFWVSSNSGDDFQRISGPHVDHQGFAVDPVSPEIIYTVCDGGIYRSTDRGATGSWEFIGEGITNVEFYDISDAATAPSLVIGGTQDNGTLKYDGSSTVWEQMIGGDGATVDIDPENADIMYAGGQNIGIKRSNDGGDDFPPIRVKEDDDPSCFNPHFQVHPSITSIVLESCESLWIGPSPAWFILYTPELGKIKRSAVDPSVNLYYAGSDRGELYAGPSGLAWRKVFETESTTRITDIEIDPVNPAIVYISTHGNNDERVFRLIRSSPVPTSMNENNVTSNLPEDVVVQALAVDRMRPFTIYAGTNQGVYRARSTDGGLTWGWTSYNNGLPNAVSITELNVHPTTGLMRASTFGRSAFEVNTDFPIGSRITTEGKITMLRVHDKDTKYGPSEDQIDVEVVIWLDSEPGKAFGFQLRDDAKGPARQGMLDLLRDAFNHDWTVRIDYDRTGFLNGLILRVREIF